MEQIECIKELQLQGASTAEIAKKLSVDWKTVRKYEQINDFSPKPILTDERSSKLDCWKPIIDEWLKDDLKNRYKQRHTAQRVFDRLQAEHPGFQASYSTVRRYVKCVRESKRKECFLELVWPPGEAQVDFGEADFDTPDGRKAYKYLCVSFPHSNAGFTQIFGGETAECVCHGLQDIFEHLGGVPTRLIFDNATGVGRRVGEKIQFAELFRRFKLHHGLQVSFCNPAAGHEKGNVERKVAYLRSNRFVPVPWVEDLQDYNKRLFEITAPLLQKNHYKKRIPIVDLLQEDQTALLALPRQRFNVCRYEKQLADGYGKICLDGKHYYSTTPEWAGTEVMVGIRAHVVEILKKDGDILVSHQRSYSSERSDILDHSTSLALLLKNIGAWNNCGLRSQTPKMLRQTLDGQTREELRKSLRILSELSTRYGFDTAILAMDEAVKRSSLNICDTAVLAARLAGYGLHTPPELGPDLNQYDKLLLQQGGDLQ